ncbi:MAG: DUF4239 domain-containing protein [Pseudolabrys sp.]|nr:DUF4239 domain-containing protein [Pseudolabrys sp.]
MIEAWIDLPAPAVFAVLTALYAATGALIVWAAFGRPLAPSVRRFDGLVAPFFNSVAILFALMAGFLASDIADRNRQAGRAVQTEAAELRNVFTLSVASQPDMAAIRADWTDYVKAVTRDEWPAMADGYSAPSADKAFDALLRELSEPSMAANAGPAVSSALINAAMRVSSARSERLALASDSTSDLKWAIVLILGIMTQVAIGAVHLQKRAAQTAALVVFSVAAVIALGLIALQEHPFSGAVRVGPEPLIDLLKLQGPNGGT